MYLNGLVYFKIPSFVRDFFYPSFSVLGTSSGGVSQSEPLHGKFSPNPHESNAELNSINMYLKNFISPLVDIIQINNSIKLIIYKLPANSIVCFYSVRVHALY